MKPSTTITEFHDFSWQILLVVAIGLYFEGTVSREWLEREVSELSLLEEDDYEDE